MTRRATKRRAMHDHCEALNDRHEGYCRAAGTILTRQLDGRPMFVCPAHAEGRDVRRAWGPWLGYDASAGEGRSIRWGDVWRKL